MTTTLVIRLSSLGDIAIAVPVLYLIAKKYPDDHFVLITKNEWQSLFFDKLSNLTVFPVFSKGKHKGIRGIIKLLRELSQTINTKNIKVADIHGVIRSYIIDFYFRFKGKQVIVIYKGRKDKQELIREKNKKLRPLKTTIDRYKEVFEKLGYDSTLHFSGLFPKEPENEQIMIGIAPFAKHKGKIYPLEQMEKVVSLLSESDMEIILFGSKEESLLLESWAEKYPNTKSLAGRMNMQEELLLMNQIDLIVSMDSANMHLASLVNTPVISIWGATHPYLGFYGFNQNESNIIQLDLPCRPCSTYGNKPCKRGDYACLNQITPEIIVEKITSPTR